MLFDAAWFARWQPLLVAILEEPMLGRWFRWILCIRPGDVGHRARIVRLVPHAYVIANPDGSFTADVRSHPKYARRLYHAGRPLWRACHVFDTWIANPLAPAWNLGFDSLTAYPDAHPETTTVDGYVSRQGDDLWSTIRAGAGTNADDAIATTAAAYFTASTTSARWTVLARFIALFDTRVLTSEAVISAAVLSAVGVVKTDTLGVTPTIDVYTAAPASNVALVPADFATLGAVSQTGAPLSYAAFVTGAYNAWTLNATGRAAIDGDGISKFGFRNANYDVAALSPAWSAGNSGGFVIATADTAGLTSDPKLVITYTLPPSSPVTHVTVAGVEYGTGRAGAAKVLYESVTITDGADEQPSSCLLTLMGVTPTVGQPVIVRLGALRVFAGTIQTVTQAYLGDNPINAAAHVAASDYTVGLDRRKVTARYTATSATAIAQAIIATYAGGYGYTSAGVAAGLDTIDEITFTNQDLTECLTQLAKRIGGYWYCDYYKDVHLFTTEPGSDPAPLTPSSPYLRHVTATGDLSQVVTRVAVEGGGVNALAEVAPGATILPVEDGAWYSASGGIVVSGPQRITYTGITQLAAPSTAPARAVSSTVGRLIGSYRWKIAFANSQGETIPGPASTALTCAAVPGPGAAPSITGAGLGPLVGAYGYAVSFLTAFGETALGGATARTASTATAPGGPIASVAGAGNLFGTYAYKVGVVSTYGETLGAASAGLTAVGIAAVNSPGASGSNSGAGTYNWCGSWLNNKGQESTPGAAWTIVSSAIHNLTFSAPSGAPSGVTRWRLYRTTLNGATYKLVGEAPIATGIADNNFPDADLGQPPPLVATLGQSLTVSSIATGAAGTLARRLYRTKAGGSLFYLVAEIPDNTTGAYVDNAPDDGLSVAPPLQNLQGETHALTGIPTGPAGTIGRKVYRTKAGGAAYFLLTQIGDNSTTTWTDAAADSSLGAGPPVVATAGGAAVTLSSIPIGGAGITQRLVYRTEPSGSEYKYVGVINDNTSTTFLDDGAATPGRLALVASTIGAALSGIPASGAGAILYTIKKGDPVNVLVVVNDAAAQAALAALRGGGDDGIQEGYIQDRRISITEAIARGEAELLLRGSVEASLRYDTRDPLTRAGRSITINLPPPTNIVGTFRIQRVTIAEFDAAGRVYPNFAAEASSTRFSLEDLLRLARKT